MKVATIVGARPQFIKAAAVSRAIAARDDLVEMLIHTGQHFDHDMSNIFFRELGIPRPGYELGLGGGTHGQMTGRMLEAIEAILLDERPTAVIVYGDTNSTIAGALAAAKLRVPVVHVEGGLRSFNRAMPEEINRVMTDHLSDLLLCPTATAVANLAREGITAGVHAIGDVMYDATVFAAETARSCSDILARLGLEESGYAIATLHRAENVDDPARLAVVLEYLHDESRARPVVFPMHPRTRAAVDRMRRDLSGLRVCPPVGYLDMHRLLQSAAVVYTDSGGLQKEAYFHRVPCVTLREETEWVETVAAGWNRLWRNPEYLPPREIEDYGDGHAAERAVDLIVERYRTAV